MPWWHTTKSAPLRAASSKNGSVASTPEQTLENAPRLDATCRPLFEWSENSPMRNLAASAPQSAAESTVFIANLVVV